MTNHDANPLKSIFPGADEFFNALFGGISPSSTSPFTPKVKETAGYVEYKFPLPGVSQDKVVPVAKDRLLTVSIKDSKSESNKTVYRVLLKSGLDHENAVAECKDGMLTIQIPFSENRAGVKVGFGKLREEPADEATTETI